MSDQIRTGTKKSHRERKNGASREAWEKQKFETNTARGPQEIFQHSVEIGNSKTVTIRRVRG